MNFADISRELCSNHEARQHKIKLPSTVIYISLSQYSRDGLDGHGYRFVEPLTQRNVA